MGIKTGLIEGLRIGVGYGVAQAYGACPCQSLIYSTVNTLVLTILKRIACTYYQNSRQYFFLAHIGFQAISGLAGVLMTRLLSEKPIQWRQALASSVISETATIYAFSLIYPIPIHQAIIDKNA